jgi:hypothetical protein
MPPTARREHDYRRALALRAAGDVDGCLLALQSAWTAPRLRFASASMLARVLRERGARDQAIVWFDRAARETAPTVDEGHEVLYELADTLEQEGDAVRALAVLVRLRSQAGPYRDVASRIDRLTRAQQAGG